MTVEEEGGFIFATGPCFCCGQLFAFNPVKVPSYEGHPICRSCIVYVNERRRAEGKEEWPIPEGAYEPAAAEEIP